MNKKHFMSAINVLFNNENTLSYAKDIDYNIMWRSLQDIVCIFFLRRTFENVFNRSFLAVSTVRRFIVGGLSHIVIDLLCLKYIFYIHPLKL